MHTHTLPHKVVRESQLYDTLKVAYTIPALLPNKVNPDLLSMARCPVKTLDPLAPLQIVSHATVSCQWYVGSNFGGGHHSLDTKAKAS